MVDRESLRNYQPPQPGLESVDGNRLTLYCADDLPQIGETVAVVGPDDRRLWTVVERHVGARRVEAWTFGVPTWLEPELPIELTGRTAAFDFDSSHPLLPDAETIHPLGDDDDAVVLWPEAPQWTELDPRRPALPLGIDALDVLAPITSGGVNLIIETSSQAVFPHIARRVADASSPDIVLVTGRQPVIRGPEHEIWRIDPGNGGETHIAALQCTIALAARLREFETSLAIVELPPLSSSTSQPSNVGADPAFRAGVADIVDRLGRHLTSTKNHRITSLVRLDVPGDSSGLDTIIATLPLGDVDTAMYVDAEGRFDPERSHSRADVDDTVRTRRQRHLQTLDLASGAGDKSAIFGDVELTDVERRALREVGELRPCLTPPNPDSRSQQ